MSELEFLTEQFESQYGLVEHRIIQTYMTREKSGPVDDADVDAYAETVMNSERIRVATSFIEPLSGDFIVGFQLIPNPNEPDCSSHLWWYTEERAFEFIAQWTREERLEEFKQAHPRQFNQKLQEHFPEEWAMAKL